MQATIDLDILDQGKENPFEKLMSAYERVKLQMEEGKVSNDFEKRILYLERVLQDLSEKQDEISNSIVVRSKEILNAYSTVIDNDESLGSLDLIIKSVDSIATVINYSYAKSKNELNIEFDNLSPSKYLRSLDIFHPTFDQLKQAAVCSVYTPHILSGFTPGLTSPFTEVEKKNQDAWDISLNFFTSKRENHKPLGFINIFVEVLSKIEGVEMSIEDIKIGSIKVTLRVEFKNDTAKEEFKNVLEESIQVVKELSQEIKSNLEDTINENIFLDHKKTGDEEKSDILNTAYLNAIKIKIAEEELHKKQLENERLKLQIMQETIDTNSKLLANTFLSQRDYEILIKGIPFLKAINGQIQIGESTRIIDDL